MKKWILALAVVALASFGASAQTVSLSYDDGNNGFKLLTEKPHEVKLNLITSTVMLHPEVAYDYTINTDLSVGGRVSFNIKNDNDQADETNDGNCREDQGADPGTDRHIRVLPCVGIAVIVVHIAFLLLSKFRGYYDYNT